MTITIGNTTIATFTRRLDVLPGDFNDDGVVNAQDLVGVRNEWLHVNGATYTIFGDINGDGVVNLADYNDVRAAIGTSLPAVSASPAVATVSLGAGVGASAGRRGSGRRANRCRPTVQPVPRRRPGPRPAPRSGWPLAGGAGAWGRRRRSGCSTGCGPTGADVVNPTRREWTGGLEGRPLRVFRGMLLIGNINGPGSSSRILSSSITTITPFGSSIIKESQHHETSIRSSPARIVRPPYRGSAARWGGSPGCSC